MKDIFMYELKKDRLNDYKKEEKRHKKEEAKHEKKEEAIVRKIKK